MSQNYISIAGGAIKLNGHSPVEFNFDRLKLLKKHNNVKLTTVFNKPNTDINIGNVQDLINTAIKHWKLDMAYVHCAGYLHECICKKYMEIIKASGKKYNSAKEKKPGNYTGACVELSIMSWDGYDGGEVKGFCPCEPDVRLKQLANFPIEYFNNGRGVMINTVSIPTKPEIDEVKLDSNDIIVSLNVIKPQLYKWEQYYKDMITAMEKIVKNINSDI
jgi:hypothetical protein